MSDSSVRESVDWLVFGDDWGRHPSTTQHLVRALPPSHRVLWVGSLGMREPRLARADLVRVVDRARSLFSARPVDTQGERASFRAVTPRVLPFHGRAVPRALNGRLLSAQLRDAMNAMGIVRPVTLVSAPVAALYLRELELGPVLYLRLDDHPRLHGVDPDLARAAERELLVRADTCIATATTLALPGRTWTHLPQGVDAAHFGRVPLELPRERVLGFFGAIAPWLDVELVRAAAARCPDWTFELVGPVLGSRPSFDDLPNVRVLPRVPYADLPALLARWRGSWIPFLRNELVRGVDPLKARESLAAGLPTLSTPIPALEAVREVVCVRSADDVAHALDEIVRTDSPERRLQRRRSVAGDTWSARAEQLARLARTSDRRRRDAA